jgi:hypothetical protein
MSSILSSILVAQMDRSFSEQVAQRLGHGAPVATRMVLLVAHQCHVALEFSGNGFE